MQAPNPRQQQILALAREKGAVTVDDLALRFDVTPQTIRKDLNELCDARLLARTHGGAMLSSGVENLAYEARRHMAAAEKVVIGKHAARLIPNDCSLFINIGTTTEEVARALVHHEGLLVITNNIHVASILMPCPGIEVILAGGMVRKSDGGIIGEAAADFISLFKVDHAVIGASALDEDGDLLDFDLQEVRVSQTLIRRARKTCLVCDASKFQRKAPVRIASLRDIDRLVTDRPLVPALAGLCAEWGTEVAVTG